MKTNRLMISAVAGLAAIGSAFAADSSAKADARTEVNFSHPEKFADVRDAYMGSDKGRDGILDQLRDYIDLRAKRYVPEGQKLVVNVTDIDLAGDYEPWRGPSMTDVRVVKDIYPPKIDLDFKLVDSTGKVVKEGKRQLRDLAFMMKLSINRDDNLRFEKGLIDDWLQDDFKRAKSG
ncbi:MAG: hypothetical protein JWM32_2494 [Verrucomicrobia bacterium]|nr:hypothetical protein [Verrucomicrobiota bacterium]